MNRPSVLHGRFYEADPKLLALQVDAWLADESCAVRLPAELRGQLPGQLPAEVLSLRDNLEGKPLARGLLLPHAGHMFCGRVIGQTLARCRLPERLILLCPNHTGPGAELAVWPEGSWTTPLGDVPVDAELCEALLAEDGYKADMAAHRGEHSLEVLLPFLQHHTPTCRIAPVRVSCGPEELKTGAAGLARVLLLFARQGQDVGVIISSDMNHYATEDENMRQDTTALVPLLRMDAVNLFNTVHARGISMCGVGPATLALLAFTALEDFLPPVKPHLVAYATSAEASGDSSGVVGYAGVVLL